MIIYACKIIVTYHISYTYIDTWRERERGRKREGECHIMEVRSQISAQVMLTEVPKDVPVEDACSSA